MSLQTIIILLLLGISAGILSGLVGVGGGIIIVPALVLLLGFTQKQAQGTSLAIFLLPVGIIAVAEYYKGGYINIKYALLMAVAFVVGSYFGSKFALIIPGEKLKKIFAFVLMLLSLKMLFLDKSKKASPEKITAEILQ